MPDGPNIFTRLHKWATRQDENFLTESLAVMLEQLLIRAPDVGVRLVSWITGEFLHLAPGDAGTIVIRTQVEAETGRPDLELKAPHRLAWVEVKAESELRTGQLEGYRVLLGESGVEHTCLILLTRYPVVLPPDEAAAVRQIRWFEVADCLEEELPALRVEGEVAVFLAQQFLEFLEVRGMTLTQVGKYMPEGLRALSNLLNMLVEAASACKVKVQKRPYAWNRIGLALDGKYWVGFDLIAPDKLWFEVWSRIDPQAAVKLGVGELMQGAPVGRNQWRLGAELDSEEVHFYSRNKISQMEWLEKFLRDCLEKARSIETPDQPPISEPSEGN